MSRIRTALPALAISAVFLVGGCESPSYRTPLEKAEGDFITPHAEMLAFLGDLQERTGAFTMETIGTSVEGRDLVLLHFTGTEGEGEAPTDKLKVLIFTQQHGNEPSGTEAALALARDIAIGSFSGILDRIDFYLIPRVNPDGSEARQRENADGVDLNRDHLTLSTPEVRAVHDVFNEVMPQVVLDVHEYGITSRAWVDQGIRKNFGEQIGALSNPNMSLNLRTFAWDRVIPEMREALASKEVSLNRYLVSDGPNARFRYSTAALNDGRNSTGIYDALTFLIEGRNGLTVEENMGERARQQLETMKAFLGFFTENAGQVKRVVEREQSVLAGAMAPPVVALVMDYVPDQDRPTVTVGVVDVETGEEGTLSIEDFHPLVEPTGFVERPVGYVLPPELTDVIRVLERHQIPMTILDAPMPAEVEAYRVTQVETSVKEDKEFLDVGVSTRRETMEIPAGHIVVPTQGIQTNLIVSLLEPQSQWGLAPLPEFVWMLEPGSDYPILRVLGPAG
jgi:hypothetical protein